VSDADSVTDVTTCPPFLRADQTTTQSDDRNTENALQHRTLREAASLCHHKDA
jgi:hypothetical protein